MYTAIRTSAFLCVCGSSHCPFIYSVDRVCLVNRVDLVFSLYSCCEGFGSALVFNCGFVSTCACGSSTGVCSWGCPGGLGCGGVAAAWVAGVLAAPGTQESWGLGQQEIQCSRRVWQLVLDNMLQYSCLEIPSPWQRSPAGHTVYKVAKSWTQPKQPCMHRCKTFFACGSSAPVRVEHERDTATWLVGTLVAPSVQGHRLPLSQELWPYQSLFLSLL